jgi:hypothetical protein
MKASSSIKQYQSDKLEADVSIEIGKQYNKDYAFMASARLHQSKYRAETLKVECDEYGNRLNENDAKNL